MNNIYDCIIIGAGPAGMSAALYLKNANKNVLIIEKDIPGGTLNKIKTINNYPGYLDEDGISLAFNMYQQIEKKKIDIKKEDVIKIEKENNFIVYTNYNKYFCKYIIIASGKIPKKLNIENADKYIGNGISYCPTCDGILYKEKTVVIVGDGNNCIDTALYLKDIAKKVYIINKKNRLSEDIVNIAKLNDVKNIEILNNCSLKKIVDNCNKIEAIYLDNDRKLDIDGIFVCYGNELNSAFYQGLNIKQDKFGIIVNDSMETNIKGIYAAGDSISKKVYQVITASSEGAKAACDIIKKLN